VGRGILNPSTHHTSPFAMRHINSAFTVSRLNTPLLLVPLLAGTLLLATGCSSTHRVTESTDGQKARRANTHRYSRVTEEVSGKTVRVSLRNGQWREMENLHVGPDSTTGTQPDGNQISFPTSMVKKVEFRKGGRGFLEGLGIGAGTALGSAVLAGFASDGPLGGGAAGAALVVLLAGPQIAFIGGLTGGVIGGAAGHRRTYLFPESSPGSDSTGVTHNTRQARGSSHK